MLFTPVSCSDSPDALGREIPDGERTALAAVVAEPDLHRSRELRLEGVLDEVCPTAGCWAYLSGGDTRLRLEFRSFTLDLADRGRRCRVIGRLADQDGAPVFSVHGLRFENAP